MLSRLAKRVYSIEIVRSLGEQARERLDKRGYRNVEVLFANGYLGWPEKAPFDRIILTAAPEEVPQALVDQLAAPGRLVAPVGASGWSQDLIVIDKDAAGKTRRRTVLPVRFVPMVDNAEAAVVDVPWGILATSEAEPRAQASGHGFAAGPLRRRADSE